jgi:hypothetical protein
MAALRLAWWAGVLAFFVGAVGNGAQSFRWLAQGEWMSATLGAAFSALCWTLFIGEWHHRTWASGSA